MSVCRTLVLTSLLVPAVAGADETRAHDGFFLRAGVGPGWMAGSTAIPSRRMTISGASVEMDVSLGGSVWRGVHIGVGYFGSVAPRAVDSLYGDRKNTVTTSMAGPLIDVYPDPARGLHFELAGGYTLGRAHPAAEGFAGGFAVVIGAGWDGFALGPLDVGVLARLKYADQSSMGYRTGDSSAPDTSDTCDTSGFHPSFTCGTYAHIVIPAILATATFR